MTCCPMRREWASCQLVCNRASGRRPFAVLQAAEDLDDPDDLIGDAEEDPHAVIPARRPAGLASHGRPFRLPSRRSSAGLVPGRRSGTCADRPFPMASRPVSSACSTLGTDYSVPYDFLGTEPRRVFLVPFDLAFFTCACEWIRDRGMPIRASMAVRQRAPSAFSLGGAEAGFTVAPDAEAAGGRGARGRRRRRERLR